LTSRKDAGHKSKNFAALFTIKQMLSKTHKIDKKSESTNLTIAVLALNEASMITSCLQSASFAEQILVIDSGSSDDTMLIARSLGAEVHSYPDWQGFAIQRNRALKHCHKDYVFFLDCDEIIPVNLANEILEIVKQGLVNRGLIRWDDFVFGKRLQGFHGRTRKHRSRDITGSQHDATIGVDHHQRTAMPRFHGTSARDLNEDRIVHGILPVSGPVMSEPARHVKAV
jgi:glycosyltransferase involved in cell wall biosynthesis